MISHKHKLIFIHIPKCAGTSIENALGHYEGHTANRGGQDHRSIRMIEQPLWTPRIVSSAENMKEFVRRLTYRRQPIYNQNNLLTVTRKQYRDYYKFSIVRNPWLRVFSWYRNVITDPDHLQRSGLPKSTTFKQFLQRFIGTGMIAPQTYWLKDFRGIMPLDFIGKFETLADDFKQVCNTLDLSGVELPHKIKGQTNDYREHFDTFTVDLIAHVYQEEIELFGYTFDG